MFTIFDLFDLFARARAHQPLSPAERAVLKLAEAVLDSGIVSALGMAATLASGRNPVVLSAAVAAVGGAFLKGLLSALRKVVSARSDVYGAFGTTIIDQATQAIDQRLGTEAGASLAPVPVGAAVAVPAAPSAASTDPSGGHGQ